MPNNSKSILLNSIIKNPEKELHEMKTIGVWWRCEPPIVRRSAAEERKKKEERKKGRDEKLEKPVGRTIVTDTTRRRPIWRPITIQPRARERTWRSLTTRLTTRQNCWYIRVQGGRTNRVVLQAKRRTSVLTTLANPEGMRLFIVILEDLFVADYFSNIRKYLRLESALMAKPGLFSFLRSIPPPV